MRNLILKTWSNNEHWNGDCDYAVVEIARAWIEDALKRIRLIRWLDDVNLYSLRYWEWLPRYYCWSDRVEQILEDLDNKEALLVECETREDEAQRTECSQMIVYKDGVRWDCYVKHSSTKIETATVSFDMLREMLKEAKNGDGEKA